MRVRHVYPLTGNRGMMRQVVWEISPLPLPCAKVVMAMEGEECGQHFVHTSAHASPALNYLSMTCLVFSTMCVRVLRKVMLFNGILGDPPM